MPTDQAILIRKHPYRETSMLVTWLTRYHGKIRTLARGGAGGKKSRSLRLDLFQRSEVTWRLSSRSDLHFLQETALQEAHTELAREYPRMLCASYFTALVDQSTQIEHPVEAIFGLLEKSLEYLRYASMTPALIQHFEFRLCEELGFWPPGTSKTASAGILKAEIGELPAFRRELKALLSA